MTTTTTTRPDWVDPTLVRLAETVEQNNRALGITWDTARWNAWARRITTNTTTK